MTVMALREDETLAGSRATTMKAIVHKGYGRPGPGVLEVGELYVPEIEDHQALVRVHE